MNLEELYEQHEYLAEVTLTKMFRSPRGVAKRHRIEYQDLLQMARLGLWNACKTYDPNKGTKFTSHSINHVRWYVLQSLRRDTSLIKYNPNKTYLPNEKYRIVSIDGKLIQGDNDFNTYHDIVASEVDVVGGVIDNINSNNIWNRLEDNQKEIIYLRETKGMSLREIGEMWGMTGENVRAKLNKAKRKLNNLREVGLV